MVERMWLCWLCLVTDTVCVLLFAFIGRLAHGESPLQTLSTAVPFLVALLTSWILPRVRKNPVALFPAGVWVWLITVLLGQLLRVIFGGDPALSFIVVTLCALGVLTLGWRLLAKFTLQP